jgi:PKD repeat protein
VTVSNPGNYTVTATAANGCTSTSSITITQNLNLPQVSFSASTQSGCPVTCVNFTDNSTSAGSNIVAWNWSYNGIEFSTSQIQISVLQKQEITVFLLPLQMLQAVVPL